LRLPLAPPFIEVGRYLVPLLENLR